MLTGALRCLHGRASILRSLVTAPRATRIVAPSLRFQFSPLSQSCSNRTQWTTAAGLFEPKKRVPSISRRRVVAMSDVDNLLSSLEHHATSHAQVKAQPPRVEKDLRGRRCFLDSGTLVHRELNTDAPSTSQQSFSNTSWSWGGANNREERLFFVARTIEPSIDDLNDPLSGFQLDILPSQSPAANHAKSARKGRCSELSLFAQCRSVPHASACTR